MSSIQANLIKQLDDYYQFLLSCDCKPERCETKPHTQTTKQERLNHVCWLALESKKTVEQGFLDQARRALYFIQGALWAFSDYEDHPLKPEEAERADAQ